MRTILLALVSMIAALLQIAGVEISRAEREGLVNNLVIVVAAILGIYTRYEATRNLKTGGLLQPDVKVDGNEN